MVCGVTLNILLFIAITHANYDVLIVHYICDLLYILLYITVVESIHFNSMNCDCIVESLLLCGSRTLFSQTT